VTDLGRFKRWGALSKLMCLSDMVEGASAQQPEAQYSELRHILQMVQRGLLRQMRYLLRTFGHC
jgi:hypothetical protein